MADLLNSRLSSITQRTSSSSGSLTTEAQRSAFVSNVRADLANVIDQLNTVYKPLASSLSSTLTLNALDFGLSGNVLFTDVNATAGSSGLYYSVALGRAYTIKETVDLMLAELVRLENQIESALVGSSYDDTELRTWIGEAQQNLIQLAADTMGTPYELEEAGEQTLTYPLAQYLDALSDFFTGWPTTGNTYEDAFPALTFSGAVAPHATSHIRGGSDQIDGDRLDLDYVPTNYTRDATAPTGGHAEHLAGHLMGLDNALGAQTLQSAYGHGADGSAGNLTLTEAKGKLSVRGWNDLTDVVVEVLGYDSASLIALDSSGIETEVPLYLVGAGAQADRTGFGQLYVDLVSADNELFYKDDSGTAKQITSNGSINHTLQQAYTVPGSSGTAGRVAVTSGGGAFAVKSPDLDGTMQFFKLTDGDNGTTLESSSIRHKTFVPLTLFESTPVADEALSGQLYTSNVGGRTELHYADDQGTAIQITDNGALAVGGAHAAEHIKDGSDELDGDLIDIDYPAQNYNPDAGATPATDAAHLAAHLGGIDTAIGEIVARDFVQQIPITTLRGHSGFAAPVMTDYTFAGGSGDKRHFGLAFDTTAFEYTYAYFAVPVSGNTQTSGSGDAYPNVRFRFFVVAPTYTSGSGWRFTTNIYTTAIGNNTDITSTAGLCTASITGITSSEAENLFIMETNDIAVSSGTNGLVRARIYRDVSDVDDTWGSDVVLLHVEAIWSF